MFISVAEVVIIVDLFLARFINSSKLSFTLLNFMGKKKILALGALLLQSSLLSFLPICAA